MAVHSTIAEGLGQHVAGGPVVVDHLAGHPAVGVVVVELTGGAGSQCRDAVVVVVGVKRRTGLAIDGLSHGCEVVQIVVNIPHAVIEPAAGLGSIFPSPRSFDLASKQRILLCFVLLYSYPPNFACFNYAVTDESRKIL